jgi:predicted N-acyltransferase
VAGALNFIGGDALYGRYWGAIVDRPFLHFELCYYQAIDAAIALGLGRVEAGRRASTSWRAATSRCARGRPTTSWTRDFGPPSPIFSNGNGRAWRRTS